MCYSAKTFEINPISFQIWTRSYKFNLCSINGAWAFVASSTEQTLSSNYTITNCLENTFSVLSVAVGSPFPPGLRSYPSIDYWCKTPRSAVDSAQTTSASVYIIMCRSINILFKLYDISCICNILMCMRVWRDKAR